MNEHTGFEIDDRWILSKRGGKNPVDPHKPYAWLIEKERTAAGSIEETAVIFLTNRECAYHCLMCDLWKNTTDFSVHAGAIPSQIEWALNQLPETQHLKLYNSGSFFDSRAIPVEDYPAIASLISHFHTVVVESHPRLINEKCLHFRDTLKPDLQVALGLETVHPEILRKLNKRMTLEDFENSVKYLNRHEISSRAFILLKPPFLSEEEGIYWAKKSVEFAFITGVECCTVIPVRAGNGAMDLLMEKGHFSPPDIRSLEEVLEYGIRLNAGRVLADVWDIGLFSSCKKCIAQRTRRLIEMNLKQEIIDRVECTCDPQVSYIQKQILD
jgi:radical SAM enzyme (TIGR01210 family)